ncbi:MAG: SCP2 sterol-binding domain-containing protein [Deltaproteobacteria bacterium]|nr:SCP2 sterol-binding domain-containing protein [Deltaproteobacteria bacterium]
MDAQRFFDIAIPELAAQKDALFSSLHGRLAFIIKDVGQWTVHLGNADIPVVAEAERDADLVLSFEALAFEEFLAGTLDLQEAMSKNRIAHDGDLKVLQHFSRLLQGPSSPLFARTR